MLITILKLRKYFLFIIISLLNVMYLLFHLNIIYFLFQCTLYNEYNLYTLLHYKR